MSRLPNTSLVVNQRGVDSISYDDVVYLMAPSLRGGEKRDEHGEVVYLNGYPVYEAKLTYSLAEAEQEFGLVDENCPLTVYAKMIYDYGNYPILCRRVASEDIQAASAVLQSEDGFPALKLVHNTQDTYGNATKVDIDESTNVNGYIQKQVFFYDKNNLLLSSPTTRYNLTDRLIFEGQLNSSRTRFRAAFFGNPNIDTYRIFDLLPIQGTIKFQGQVGDIHFSYAGDDVPSSLLGTRECSYNSIRKTLVFGSAIEAAWQQSTPYALVVKSKNIHGEIEFYFSLPLNAREVDMDMSANNVEFLDIFLNGFGHKNSVKYDIFAKISSINRQPGEKYFFQIIDGTTTGTKKLIIETDTNKREIYDNISVWGDLGERLDNIKSKLIRVNIYQKTAVAFSVPSTEMQLIGFRVSVYKNGYAESYNDMRDVDEAVYYINGLSVFVTAEAIADNGGLVLQPIIGKQFIGGNSGLNATTVDYLDALLEARNKNNVTIVIAPGVSDFAFQMLLKEHCEEMTALGKRRMTLIGGELDETVEEKIEKTRIFNSERVVMIGDGLVLLDPITKVRKVFSPSVVSAVLAGRIVSTKYYVSLTNQYITNSYGTEHKYTDMQLEKLHDARLLVFRNNSGVQICDGITTSVYNAYEDIHMVRIYDAISKYVDAAMWRAVGESNIPPTWVKVTQIIRKALENLKNIHAIDSYILLNETLQQDIVDRRAKFRIGIIPIFPIKYVEGFVDIIPPTILL